MIATIAHVLEAVLLLGGLVLFIVGAVWMFSDDTPDSDDLDCEHRLRGGYGRSK